MAEGRPCSVHFEDLFCAVLCRPAPLLLPVFCAWFQPCGSSDLHFPAYLDTWVLASWTQLYPSSNLPLTAQLGPLVAMLRLGTFSVLSGLVWGPGRSSCHCPFPVCPVVWCFMSPGGHEAVGLAAPT